MRRLPHAAPLTRRQSVVIFASGLSFALLVAVLVVLRAAPIERLDNVLLDLFVRSTVSGEQARHVVVVDIDERSLSALGQWPWPRYRIASLTERVAAAEPAAIALDILFAEADRSSLINIQQTYKRDFGLDLSFDGVPRGLLDSDAYLGEVIAQTGAVTAEYLYFDHHSDAPAFAPQWHVTGRTDLLRLAEAQAVMAQAPGIADKAAARGFINTGVDSDGVLRRTPLLIDHAGTVHPSLALAAVMRSLHTDSASVESGIHGLVLRVADRRIPIDTAGNVLLHFNGGPAQYESVSALDVLSGQASGSRLKGRTVFIGTTAIGLNDLHATAVGTGFPGLKLQAVLAENFLQQTQPATPSWSIAALFTLCLLAGAVVSAIFATAQGVLPMLAGSLLAGASMLLVSLVLYVHFGWFVPVGAPIAVVVLLAVGLFVSRFAIEKRRARDWLVQLENTRKVTMESMAAVAETRDPDTGAHIKRTQEYVRVIAEELRRDGHYREILTDAYIDLLFISAPLHDVGKVGVPDHILLKPGRLTDDEMRQMKEHAEFGRRILCGAAQGIEGDNFLVIAADIAGAHHEKWDGTGYPRGLAGDDIPLAGRIMALADIYDALISRRCYKEPFPHSQATTLLREMRGTTFDPLVLDAFFRIEVKIQQIAARYRDESDRAPSGSGALAASRA